MTDIDITQDANLTSNTSPALADRLLLIRNADSVVTDIIPAEFLKVLNLLTEDTAPDRAADFALVYDVSTGEIKKVLLRNLGAAVQIVHTETGAVATGTTTIPSDDTIPQNTEGTEFLTLAITPTNTNNKLLIEVVLICAYSIAAQIWVALFQDTTANSLAVVGERLDNANNVYAVVLRHEMTAGTTSSTTFKIRAGSNAAGTLTVNGSAGARLMGGVFSSLIRITEYRT